MIALVLSIILFLIAFGAAGLAVVSSDARFGAGIASVICFILGTVILVFACYDRVDTRNVGIITAFGRPNAP